MKSKFLSIIFLTFYSSFSNAALVTFQSGQIAKAEDFNNNFTELDNSFSTLDNRIQNLEGSNRYVTAQVNGVNMQISSYTVGNYTVITPTGISINVDAEGYPNGGLYYEASDCAGQPYNSYYSLHTKKQTGFTYPNPLIKNTASISYDGTNVYYSVADNLVKLNYKSRGYINANNENCYNTAGTTLASKALANNPNITGINSFPLIITGVGTPLTISQEIGNTQGSAGGNVYANGILIGVTARIPTTADQSISVKLTNYNNKTISLYKDGTYTGFDSTPISNLYYLTNDCTGNAYAKVLNDYSKEWWTSSLIAFDTVSHNGNYYSLSNEIYKISAGAQSSSSAYTGACTSSSYTNQDGYKKASLTTPNFPIFTPPITIDGWTEETQYNSLPEAY